MTQVQAPPRRRATDFNSPWTAGQPPQVQAPAQFSWRAKFRSVFMVAFVIFLLGNFAAALTTPLKFDPYKYSYRGWTYWAMNDLRHSEMESNVALLGSSLVVSASTACDANYMNKQFDLTEYHGAAYLDDRLHSLFHGNFHTFNLSAPGQMPSDAYMMLNAMAVTGDRPDVVLYGVAPRDFYDSTLCGPNDTEPFQYLTRVVNIDEIANAAFRTVLAKFDWYLCKNVYLYDHSLDFALACNELGTKVINTLVPRPYTDHQFSWWDRTRLLPAYLPAEMHPKAMIAAPISRKDITFTDNTYEYRQRYKKPDRETYKTQMYFLRKLAEYCHRERIELVVVNMPITRQNVDLLAPGLYQEYLAGLREFAWNHNIRFYDLCDFDAYAIADYHDTVHLNAFGGRKLFDALVAELARDPRVSTALSISGLQLQKHTELAGWWKAWAPKKTM